MKKQYLAIASALFLLAACNKSTDKKAELEALKSQKQEIEAKIKGLEKELGKTEKKEEQKIVTVSVSPIQPQSFKHFVEVQGLVSSENIVQVTPQMSGQLTSVLVSVGQALKKGQLVATIDNTVLKQSMAEIKQQLDLAVTLFNKQKALWDQQIGTEIQYLQAKANKEALEKRIVTMEAQLAMTKVYAPIAGTVEVVRQKVGEMGMPGQPIFQLVNVGNLKVVGKVADTYLGSVKRGDALNVKFPDINKELNTKVGVVDALVDPVSRTFGVEAKIPNLGGSLKPNQVAIMTINDLAKANSIVILQNLIQKTELGDIVYVAVTENGKKVARGRKVKTGLSYNGNIEILEGISTGELLITQGYQDLVDGTPLSY